jgi:hypothetical protein
LCRTPPGKAVYFTLACGGSSCRAPASSNPRTRTAGRTVPVPAAISPGQARPPWPRGPAVRERRRKRPSSTRGGAMRDTWT